jgi:putative glutathione S-transferase
MTTSAPDGRFHRPPSTFRSWVTRDGAPGPSGEGGFRAEAGRYLLYIAEGCPWAHRTWIVRRLKGLEGAVPLAIVAPEMSPRGWVFRRGDARYRDPVHDRDDLRAVYEAVQPDFAGRATVPVLWDRERATIVNNESSEIVRMFNDAFAGCGANDLDLYPAALRAEIDALNEHIYERLNNGVYRAGFATTREAHYEGVDQVFATLDELEARLARGPYLFGARITEADWRLFPTLVRFDVAYVSAFGCNLRRLVDYPRLWDYTRRLHREPGVAETVKLDVYREGYHSIPMAVGHRAIAPKGPLVNFE